MFEPLVASGDRVLDVEWGILSFIGGRPLSQKARKRFGIHDPSNVALGVESFKEKDHQLGMDGEKLVEEEFC